MLECSSAKEHYCGFLVTALADFAFWIAWDFLSAVFRAVSPLSAFFSAVSFFSFTMMSFGEFGRVFNAVSFFSSFCMAFLEKASIAAELLDSFFTVFCLFLFSAARFLSASCFLRSVAFYIDRWWRRAVKWDSESNLFHAWVWVLHIPLRYGYRRLQNECRRW